MPSIRKLAAEKLAVLAPESIHVTPRLSGEAALGTCANRRDPIGCSCWWGQVRIGRRPVPDGTVPQCGSVVVQAKIAGVVLGLALCGVATVAAQAQGDFYRGKQVK